MQAARASVRAKGLEEHHRLLYVAMTRAKDRLVVAPYLTNSRLKDPPPEAWSEMIRRGLGSGQLVPVAQAYGGAELWIADPERVASTPDYGKTLDLQAPAPAWLFEPVSPEPEPAPPLRPSGALGAADASARPKDGPAAQQARLKGSLVHALLERLPRLAEPDRPKAAAVYLAARAPRLPLVERQAVVEQTLAVLARADLVDLFGPASQAEVAISGKVVTALGERPVSGRIDRLAVRDDVVLLADFKTNARPPVVGEALDQRAVTQLALYRALLREIYPSRPVHAVLIYTAGPTVLDVPEEALDEALVTFSKQPGAS